MSKNRFHPFPRCCSYFAVSLKILRRGQFQGNEVFIEPLHAFLMKHQRNTGIPRSKRDAQTQVERKGSDSHPLTICFGNLFEHLHRLVIFYIIHHHDISHYALPTRLGDRQFRKKQNLFVRHRRECFRHPLHVLQRRLSVDVTPRRTSCHRPRCLRDTFCSVWIERRGGQFGGDRGEGRVVNGRCGLDKVRHFHWSNKGRRHMGTLIFIVFRRGRFGSRQRLKRSQITMGILTRKVGANPHRGAGSK
mmetsp:Transcript_13498/g.28973  ORF Transcript_13498/g.28973 Transcript_13498/m.28973 type:complete len:247 (-) Transcript_13498:59-799(-)